MKRTINNNNNVQNQGVFSQINQPQSVKILIFVHQTIFLKDYIFIEGCTNLLRLDLSFNNINNFPKQFSLAGMHRLRVLLLHKNRFTKFNDLKVAFECKNLQFLTLFGNPLIIEGVKIRHYVINQFASLKILDQNVVVQQQKSSYIFPNSEISSCSSETKISFPIIDLSSMKSTSSYLQEINFERKIYTQTWLKCNPVIRIQRWWRKRKHLKNQIKESNKNEKQRIPLDLEEIAKKNKDQFQQQFSNESRQAVIINENSEQFDSPVDQVQQVQVKKKQTPNQKILGLFKMNLNFWKYVIQVLCSTGQIYLSKKTFAQIGQMDKLSLFVKKQLTIIHNETYKFIRNQILVKENKRLLNYFMQLNSKLIVSKISKKKKNMNQNTIVKFKQINYQKRLNSHLTQQDWSKIKISSNKLKILSHSYQENIIILKGSPEKLQFVVKVLYKQKVKQPSTACCIFFEQLVERVSAAIMIQKSWRKYCAKKKLKLIKIIKEMRAANRIQRWVRNLSYYQRNKFLKYVVTDMKNQQNSKLYIHQKIYITLSNIENHINKSKYFILPFQKDPIWYNNNVVMIDSGRSILPNYHFKQYQNKQKLQKKYEGTIYNILHTGAKVRRWIINNANFVQFQFNSTQEAKFRRMLLALKTFKFKHHFYVNSFSSVNKQTLKLLQYNYICEKLLNIKLEDLNITNKVAQYITPQIDSIFFMQPNQIRFLENQKFNISHSQCKFIAGIRTYYLEYVTALYVVKQSKPQKQINDLENRSNNVAKITIQRFGVSSPQKQIIPVSTNISTSIKPSLRYQSLGQNSIGKSANNNISIQQNAEQKKFKILQSKIQKNQMKSLRLHQRNQLLQSIRLQNDRSNLKIKEFLTSRKQEDHQQLITRNRFIHQALNKRDNSFQNQFISKGNFIMRQQFIHKVRLERALQASMQEKLIGQNQKRKKEHTETIMLMKQRLKKHRQQQLREIDDPNEQLLIKQLMKKLDEDRSRADQIQSKRKKNAKLRKIRQEMRKKIIHSVFPQQFFPLKGEQQWKLNLPKLQ